MMKIIMTRPIIAFTLCLFYPFSGYWNGRGSFRVRNWRHTELKKAALSSF